jgi:hypothetical protein
VRPVKFEGFNTNYGAPKNWDEATEGVCNTLPVFKDEAGNIISVWEPTPAERARIMAGENIVLSCYTIQPPVRLSVEPLQDVDRLKAMRNQRTDSPYLAKCKRLRLDGPTPCLCCPGGCIGDLPQYDSHPGFVPDVEATPKALDLSGELPPCSFSLYTRIASFLRALFPSKTLADQ